MLPAPPARRPRLPFAAGLGLSAALLAVALRAVPAAAAVPAPPPPVTVAADEAPLLAAGEVVVRFAGNGKETVGFVDIAAPPERVMAAVMDLPARVREIGGLKSVHIYEEVPGRLVAARWEMGLAMFTATFHIRYELDVARGYCVYTLDPGKPNDVKNSRGSYQVYAQGAGSRLVYRSVSQLDGAPEWAARKVATGSAKEMLLGMKRRAEAG